MPDDKEAYPGSEHLSPNAKKMAALQEEVLSRWAAALRGKLKEAEQLPEPILINTFPSLYQNLLQAITPHYSRAAANQGNTVASEHGAERARLTDYKPEAIVLEYQLLRATIFDVVRDHGVVLDHAESSTINYSIDESIHEAVRGYSLAQAALRERFVAALTHDLRTPVFTALASAELMQSSKDPQRIEKYTGYIVRNLRRVDSMIQKLLDIAALHSGERLRLHLRSFDLYSLANEVCEEFTTQHGARFECTGSVSLGWWDRDAIKRAIENLVSNAVKYGAPGKPIRISIRSSYGRTILDVHNEGEPIPPSEQENVFHAFQRAAAAKEGGMQGWGIGLACVTSVVEAHGGSIGVDSVAERGTTFTIDMPTDARPFEDAPTLELPIDPRGSGS